MKKQVEVIVEGMGPLDFAGEAVLDEDQGVLLVIFDDGSSRVFNWDYVISFYQYTDEELGL
ncbi:hypothetical protein SEA_ANON_45 [Gordonia phage Anon]|nr:hypothetical protein SEA_ANON_45 [Gordonia phage Anon]